jgi:rhomboid protease GluP
VTILVIGFLIVIYIVEISYGSFQFAKIGQDASINALVKYGGNANILVVKQSEWWRLLTATLLHGSILHIVMNSFSLWNLARPLEKHFGREALLSVLGLTGLIASLSFTVFGARDAISVGISGAICGALGFLVSVGSRNFKQLIQQLKRNWIIFALLFVMGVHIPDLKNYLQGEGALLEMLRKINTTLQNLLPNVDNWAHGGGVLAGILLGLIYPKFPRAIRINLGRLSGVMLLSSTVWIFKLAILG